MTGLPDAKDLKNNGQYEILHVWVYEAKSYLTSLHVIKLPEQTPASLDELQFSIPARGIPIFITVKFNRLISGKRKDRSRTKTNL